MILPTKFTTLVIACLISFLSWASAENAETPEKCYNPDDYPQIVQAALSNDIETVHRLLRADHNPNNQDRFGRTALYIAASTTEDTTNLVKLLLKYEANPNIQSTDGYTALLRALWHKNQKMVDLLLKHNAKPGRGGLGDEGKYTALHMAAYRGNYEVAKAMLPDIQDLINTPEEQGFTPLNLALTGEYSAEMIDLLLNYKANPDFPFPDGKTPLIRFSEHGKAEIVAKLLQAGVNPNIPSYDSHTALYYAAKNYQKDVVFLLLTHGAKPDSPQYLRDKRSRYAEMINLLDGHVPPEMVDLLLKHEINLDTQTPDGKTPLFRASERGTVDSVSALLQAGADPNIPDNDCHTALYAAVRNNHKAVAFLLSVYGADPDFTTVSGESARTYAQAQGNTGMIRLLNGHVPPPVLVDLLLRYGITLSSIKKRETQSVIR